MHDFLLLVIYSLVFSVILMSIVVYISIKLGLLPGVKLPRGK